MARLKRSAPVEPITIEGRSNAASAKHTRGNGTRGLEARVEAGEGEIVAAAREKADVVRAAALFDILRDDSIDGMRPAERLRTLLEGASADEIADLKRTLRAIEHPVVTTPGADPDIELAKDWREGTYPYKYRLSRKSYERQKYRLQVELLKLQAWVKETKQRVIILFEGRDAAGKGGTIKRFMEHLNPRGARVVALDKPSDVERGQWYFQRYVSHLPTAGEIVLFDRSWYNRAGVERVMGFCTEEEYQ